jgi:pimeloyl-ACP methyl ester carboxylesterase
MEFTELEKFKNNTFSLEVEEAREVFEKYRKGKLFGARPGVKMGVLGHSRGGGVALVAFCNHSDVKGICTWAAVSNFARYPKAVIDKWREDGVLEIKNARTGQILHLGWQIHEDLMAHQDGKLNIRNAVERCEKPICIIHGENDEAVSSDDARSIFEWAENAKAELHLIPDAGHTFGARHPFEETNPHLEDVIQHTLSFFKQQF